MPRKIKRILPSRTESTKAAKEERHIVTLFADIVGASEISNHMNLFRYNDFLKEFKICFEEVCAHYKSEEYEKHEHPFFQYSVRGDEGCLMIFVPSDDDNRLARDINITINIALDLKRNWLFTKHNTDRIKDVGLLPVDLAIGIHSGKVFINEESSEQGIDYRPEGYAINLAKRIESESRNGKFTHILVSESARAQLYSLRDELTYDFDKSFTIRPRGISRDIKVFEVKHHWLATDWYDAPSEVSIILKKIDTEIVKIAKSAYDDNPTNIWLAEEFIFLTMLNEHKESEVKDLVALRKAYKQALQVASRLANSELRDAGVLCTWGLIYGELEDYDEEQKKYDEALNNDPQNGDIMWYKALSQSYACYDDFKKKKLDVQEYYEKQIEEINTIIKTYRDARELRPMNPWIVFDLACELSWWSQANQKLRKEAIDLLHLSIVLNSKIKDRAIEEEYLAPIISDPDVKKYLS